MSAARSAGRSRHPSSIWRPDHDRLRQRLAADLDAEGHPEPGLAAALLSIRGRLGLDRATFCQLTGADPLLVAAVEEGHGEDRQPPCRTL